MFVCHQINRHGHGSDFTGGGNLSTCTPRKENHQSSVRNAQTATLQVFEGKHELQMLKLTILYT